VHAGGAELLPLRGRADGRSRVEAEKAVT
jgi:hypothetical protein